MIEFGGPVPVYRQIAAILAERIESGELPPHARVPSEKDLMGEYGVGRDTARAVVRLLRDEGWVYTVATRGTYVAERPEKREPPP